MSKLALRAIVLLLSLVFAENTAFGYMVRAAFTLDELQKSAGVIFKGTVVSSTPAPGADAGSGEMRTRFKIISVIKGTLPGDTAIFDHVDEVPQSLQFEMGPPPTHYHFDTGRTYLVFAKFSDTPGTLEPLWPNPTCKPDQGVILCADNRPVAGTSLKDEVWAQLTGLLQQNNDADILYAIHQLDDLSGGGIKAEPVGNFGTTDDFDRKPVIDAVHGFVANADPKVAQAAIFIVGTHNPYMSQERAEFWLATIGSADTPGLVKMDPKMENIGAELYPNDLIAVADGAGDADTRALAIRALGLVKSGDIAKHLDKWLDDPAPAVRSAATVLLADYPVPPTSGLLDKLAGDSSAEVRIATAQCIGFGQQNVHLDVLGRLLNDSDPKVRQAAAMNVLSFSPRDPAVEGIFKLHTSDDEFWPLFTLALARADPASYRDALLHAMTPASGIPIPPNGWGGEGTASAARDILFKYLKTVPIDELKSGKFDTYLDAIDKGALGNMGEGSPFEVYAFEIRHGLTARAEALRQAALKAFPYQQAISYDQARDHPEIYDQ